MIGQATGLTSNCWGVERLAWRAMWMAAQMTLLQLLHSQAPQPLAVCNPPLTLLLCLQLDMSCCTASAVKMIGCAAWFAD